MIFNHTKPKVRISSIDIAKSIATLLMIFTHTMYFFSGSSNEILRLITNFTDFTVFVSFFFLSGSGVYLSYLAPEISREEFDAKKERLLHKAFKLLLAYYLLAFISDFPNLLNSYFDLIGRILQIILFIQVPAYVEFLLPFIFVYVFVYLFRSPVKHFCNSFFWTIFLIFFFYLGGTLLYYINVPPQLVFLKALLAGEQDWFRFPLLQYSSIFLLGTLWGKIISYNDESRRVQLERFFTLGLASIALCIILIPNIPGISVSFNRWPPSFGFLLVSCSYTVLLVQSIKFLSKRISLDFGKFNPFRFISENLSDYFILHLVVLFIIKYFYNIKLSGIPELLGVYAFVLFIVTVFVLLGNSHKFLGPFREALSLRSFDALFVKLFYISISCWLVIIVGLKYVSQIDPNSEAVIAETIINNNYIQNVEDNINIEATLDRKTAFKIESQDSYYDRYKSILIDISVLNKDYFYKGVDVFVDNKLTTTLATNDINKYNWPILADIYSVGKHELYLQISGTSKKSAVLPFNVSYPLFVTWTIDWEGYDISDANLKAMEDISKKYSIPLVQLVTPRVFMASDVSATRKEVLKNWVLKRYSLGDEIGMHLHMHFDMFTGCNLPYKTTPRWDSRANGHDVLTSAYSQEEFGKLLDCALGKFKEYNFPTPVTYRAGGWFIDLKNLKVLKEKGFKIDTSGRTKYTWGLADGFWDIPTTSKPYLISNDDQNLADSINNFGLLEVPNNGMDSTNETAQTMISKFNENYPDKSGIMQEMQVLTYMSHPHWITSIDRPVLNSLFDYVSQYSADQEKGPVIFTTINKIFDYSNSND